MTTPAIPNVSVGSTEDTSKGGLFVDTSSVNLATEAPESSGTTPATPDTFTGSTDNAADGSLFTDVNVSGLADDNRIVEIVAGTGLTGVSLFGPIASLEIDSTVVTLGGTQTLTNKTLESPVITGGFTATGFSVVDGNFRIASSDTSANPSPTFELLRLDGIPAANDFLGSIQFKGTDSIGNFPAYANIYARSTVVTDGNESGRFEFWMQHNGSFTQSYSFESNRLTLWNDGKINFYNSANNAILSLLPETTTANRTVTIPNASGILSLTTATETLTNKTIDVDNNTLSNIEVDNFKSGVLDTDLTSVAVTDTTLASAKAIKTYVDSQVTSQDLDFQGDSGGALSIDLDSEVLTFTGGTGIDTSGSGNAVTFAIDSTVTTLSGTQTLTNKTLTTPIISTISNTGSLTLPTSTDTLVGRDTTDTFTNKTIDIANNTITIASTDLSDASSIDAATLDSVDSTSFLRSDVADTKTLGNLIFNDGIEAHFGTDSDLKIFHSFNQGYITNSTNNLNINNTADDSDVVINTDNGSGLLATYFKADGSTGEAILYHYGSEKLATKSAGVDVTGNLTISGDLTVNGTTTTINTQTLSVEDPLIFLANGNDTTDSVDIGFYGLYDTSGTQDLYAGLFRDASDDKFKLFKSLQTEPTSTIDTSGTGYTVATLVSDLEGNVTGNLTGNIAGNSAVSITTTTGNITIDAQGSDTDIIFKGTDGASDITALTLDMSVAGTARFNSGVEGTYLWGSKVDNNVTLFAGASFEIQLTHVHNTGFKLTNAGTGTPAVELQFVDSNEAIGSDGTNLILTSGGTAFKMPTSDGSSGQALVTDASGNLSFATAGTSGPTEVIAGTNLNGGGTSGAVTLNLDAAPTGITSIGEDANKKIDFTTSNNVEIKTSSSLAFFFGDGYFYPKQNTLPSIGLSPSLLAGFQFNNGYFAGQVEADNFETTGGIIDVKNDGTQSEVRLYCESNNAHYASLQAPAHADFSGNVTLTLPANTGTLISTANSDTPTTTTTSSDADHILIDDGGVMKKITPTNLGIGSGGSSIFTSSIELHNAFGYLNLYDSTGTYGYRISGRQTSSNSATDQGFLIEKNGGEDILQAYSSTAYYANQFKIMRGTLELRANNGSPASFKMFDSADTGSPKYIEFLVPSSGVNNTTITLPTTSGTLALTSDITGGGGGSLTIQDEGSSLTTDATTLNFVGDGVVASGTGATKTITISGSSGGGGTTSETYGASLEGKLALINDVGTGNAIIGSGDYTSLSEPVPNISTANALTILGVNTGKAITSGGLNTIIGSNTSNYLTTGNNNIIMGVQAAVILSTGYHNIMIGNSVGNGSTTDYENVYIGSEAGTKQTSGSQNVGNVAIGYHAMRNTAGNGRYSNVAIGYDAGDGITTGDHNVCIGYDADVLSQNGSSVAIGSFAYGNYASVAIGYQANRSASTSSYYNTLIGYRAGYDLDGGDFCVFIGFNAGYAGGSNSQNVGIGAYALDALSNGHDNVGIGHASLGNLNADGNTAVGYYSGVRVTTGGFNTNIGYNTSGGSYNHTGTNNSSIGNSASPSSTTSSNQFTLGNSSVTTLRCNDTSISTLSDQRDKTAIEDLDLGLDFINAMRPVSFVWNKRDGTWHGRKEVGFIAQELHEVEMDFNSTGKTRLVNYENPSKLEARPMGTYPILIKAIQELSAKVDSLQARITELEGA